MSIFLVVPINHPESIMQKLESLKTEEKLDYTPLPQGPVGAFVAFGGTSKELSDLIGISEGAVGSGVVVAVASYFGRAPTNIWEWVASRWTD